ncbi:head-to-tail stopper [Arthrobacter phage Persistence]|uniref:Head-to-tail stopper n=1 Tax=Arthrobacter phage Persistence TaxID=2836007 RepID=A0A8F3E1V1_9CAUD|nr:head-to-tail stopper [Arthrobacter phage Persistence]QWY79640.1 head-to-tail stopper [Arthrobacter phage Persistence]
MTGAVALLLRGRAKAEEQMVDTCTITRGDGTTVTDPVTGEVTEVSTEVYAGKCKVQSSNSSTSAPDAGGHTFTVVARQVHIPANAADVRDGDVITLTSSALNTFTVGKKYRVDGFTPDTYDTAARMPVKVMTS